MDKNKPVVLLKFGRREHTQAFAAGQIFFSNAQTFWGIEDNLKIKGQGDRLEASSKFFASRMTMQSLEDNSVIAAVSNCHGLVRYEPAEQMPVFCLFAVLEKDCSINDDGTIEIHLSEEIKDTIRKHFPSADSVAIIDDPEQFLCDVCQGICSRVEHGLVQYFHIAEGVTGKDGQPRMDMEYMKYLTQDVPPVIEGNKREYRFIEAYVYRALMCKDVYFQGEQEYRIVLPNEKIARGTVYNVEYTIPLRVESIDDFFK